ncbi:hypothetical protein C5167_002121 [Papaver somniferum]|uniref:Uncharacterized protein n=2 Tax=Papaver somniferum TaxID=3469 RepID=A0A4Y7KZX5_PAPSO|nr:uncharacterized protein LOC113313437 isoform X1 [Papaver somniferum]RZC77940.1 hypothetical protein C5167_002121 [Papaver somniferum]
MMNRSYSFAGNKNVPVTSQHRRGRSLTGIPKETDENLDLFSRNRRSLPVAASDESDGAIKLESIRSRFPKTAMEELLASVDGGEKHDYDWLLTPPGSPLPSSGSLRRAPLTGSVPTTKSSRLSGTQSESNFSLRPSRNTSQARPSISSMSFNNRSTNLNTSISSVTSISRPSTPGSRSSVPSAARPSTPTRQSTSVRSRPSTPSRSNERPRASVSSRPSTPTSRPQITANSVRSNSRPSTPTRPATPTRRMSAPAAVTITGRPVSRGRVLSNDHNVGPTSRGSSPNPRPRLPVALPDFSLEIPPNLRTTVPDRPISVGRSRPGASVSGRGHSEIAGPTNTPRRPSSPVVTRGRLQVPEPLGRNRLYASGHEISGPMENQTTTSISELSMRKGMRPMTATDHNDGSGRTITKKSPDMALRQMDVRPGTAHIRPLAGSLFPQSVHSGKPKSPASFYNYEEQSPSGNNFLAVSKNRQFYDRSRDTEYEKDDGRFSAKLTDKIDIYESSRYNAILFSEDLKNTSWLHSIDDTSDQGSMFDHRFEPLPELFDPL